MYYAKLITSHECGDIGNGRIPGHMYETPFTLPYHSENKIVKTTHSKIISIVANNSVNINSHDVGYCYTVHMHTDAKVYQYY